MAQSCASRTSNLTMCPGSLTIFDRLSHLLTDWTLCREELSLRGPTDSIRAIHRRCFVYESVGTIEGATSFVIPRIVLLIMSSVNAFIDLASCRPLWKVYIKSLQKYLFALTAISVCLLCRLHLMLYLQMSMPRYVNITSPCIVLKLFDRLSVQNSVTRRSLSFRTPILLLRTRFCMPNRLAKRRSQSARLHSTLSQRTRPRVTTWQCMENVSVYSTNHGCH